MNTPSKSHANTSARNNTVVLIGYSVRALAQSARRAGYQHIFTIDLFADADTQQIADQCYNVCKRHTLDFNLKLLRRAISDIYSKCGQVDAIFSSGIERHYAFMESMSDLRWLNCSAALVQQVRDFPLLASVLDRLQIPYPESVWSVDAVKGNGWLGKRNDSSGGRGVFRWSGEHQGVADYWQREIQGASVSALICVWDDDWEMIGYSRQLFGERSSSRRPFQYQGVLSGIVLDKINKVKIERYIDNIINNFKFCGLAGFDFLLTANDCYLLEINPRPTATVELFERMPLHRNLLHQHIQACAGVVSNRVHRSPSSRIVGTRVVYANDVLQIPAEFTWPLWTADLPHSGDRISRGAPVCSVFADGNQEDRVQRELAKRAQTIEDLLQQQ